MRYYVAFDGFFIFLLTMKRLLFMLFLLAVAMLQAISLDDYLGKHYRSLMNSERDALLSDMGFANKNLILVKADKSVMRYAKGANLGYDLTFANSQVVEAIFTFNNSKKLKELNISMYNRGDCGLWEAKKFKKLVKELKEALTRYTHDKSPSTSQRHLDNAVIYELVWKANGTDATLRWSGKSDDNLEYITVIFAPHKSGGAKTLAKELKTTTDLKDLPKRVQKEKDGTRWLDVPMVDQGGKGYCMAATFARFLKYYRANVDQHVIAQLLDTDPTKGTNHRSGIDAMVASRNKFDVNVKEVFTDKDLDTMGGTMEYVSLYNRLAKKAKKPTISENDLTAKQEWPFKVFYDMADNKLFIEARNMKGNNTERLMKMVKSYIDRGIPLMWFVPGHARMINGYRGNNTIIYSDSWGAGHERKEMKAKEAVAITYSIYVVTPK